MFKMFNLKNKFKRDLSIPEENFTYIKQTAAEMEAEEIWNKLECIRYALESCISEPGKFQMEKLGFIKDLVISMGFGIRHNIKENIWNSGGEFQVYTKNLSEGVENALKAQGLKIQKRILMSYKYNEIRTSVNTVKPVFTMEVLNISEVEKIEE